MLYKTRLSGIFTSSTNSPFSLHYNITLLDVIKLKTRLHVPVYPETPNNTHVTKTKLFKKMKIFMLLLFDCLQTSISILKLLHCNVNLNFYPVCTSNTTILYNYTTHKKNNNYYNFSSQIMYIYNKWADARKGTKKCTLCTEILNLITDKKTKQKIIKTYSFVRRKKSQNNMAELPKKKLHQGI